MSHRCFNIDCDDVKPVAARTRCGRAWVDDAGNHQRKVCGDGVHALIEGGPKEGVRSKRISLGRFTRNPMRLGPRTGGRMSPTIDCFTFSTTRFRPTTTIPLKTWSIRFSTGSIRAGSMSLSSMFDTTVGETTGSSDLLIGGSPRGLDVVTLAASMFWSAAGLFHRGLM